MILKAILIFALLFLFMMMGAPMAIALGASTVITLVTTTSLGITTIATACFSGLDSFPLLAVPFFILAGNLMKFGGLSNKILEFADALVGHIKGSLGMVAVVASMFFAALSGSSPATVSAIGSLTIPKMEEEGYDRAYATALNAAAGTIGVIIPPSVPFVIYGVATGTSITDLFKAGIVPGLAMGVALMIVCYIMAKKYGFKGETKKFSFKAVVKSFVDAIWALLSPVIILGGIYSGKFTPTEAAVISVVYSYIVGRFVYKELDNKGVYKALRDTIVINGSTTFMVGLSSAFAAYLSLTGIPRTLAAALIGVTDNKIILLILINIFLLVIGCLVDNIPATIILAPILLPVVEALGMSPVTFGIMLTMNLAIGFCTPPYGIDLFVASAISGVSIGKMMKFMLWFIFSLLVVLMLVTYWPAFTMFALA